MYVVKEVYYIVYTSTTELGFAIDDDRVAQLVV